MLTRKWLTFATGVVSAVFAASTGNAQAITTTIASRVLDADRTIIVRLPSGYEESSATYPVLFMTDGERLDRLTPLVDSLVRAGSVPEMIIVGIPHPDRRHDLTPTRVERMATSGGAEPFFQFLSNELIPYIDNTHRTRPMKILFGHSLGGLFVTFALACEPGLFTGYVASSPTVHWDDWYVRDRAAEAFAGSEDWEAFLFMSVGSEDIPRYIPATREFADWLEANAPDGLRWSYRVYEGEDHGTMPPLSLVDGLVEFFAGSGASH
jgi:predicted alpha/beta superfamily hydrolase